MVASASVGVHADRDNDSRYSATRSTMGLANDAESGLPNDPEADLVEFSLSPLTLLEADVSKPSFGSEGKP